MTSTELMNIANNKHQELLDAIQKVSPINHELWREIMKKLNAYQEAQYEFNRSLIWEK